MVEVASETRGGCPETPSTPKVLECRYGALRTLLRSEGSAIIKSITYEVRSTEYSVLLGASSSSAVEAPAASRIWAVVLRATFASVPDRAGMLSEASKLEKVGV